MKKLQIDEEQAKVFYPTATKEFKQILEDSFGKEFFSQKITDKIKNINDIYNYLGVTEEDIIPYKYPKTKRHLRANAFAKIECIVDVYNEGTILNWLDSNQYKYIPYFKKVSSGGWSFGACYSGWSTCAYFSGGFYYKSSELARDAGSKFIDIYNDFLG